MIDAPAAESDAVAEEALRLAITAEDVGRQREGIAARDAQRLFRLAPRDHWQDRAEDLLAHHGAVEVHLREKSRGDVAISPIRGASDETCALAQIGAHRVEAAVVHQSRVVGALLRVLAIGLLHEARESIQEFIHHRFVHERMIRRDAGLPGIEVLAPSDALGGFVDVGAAINDGGALATQLQRNRHQLLGGHRHDGPPHALTAGEEHMVETETLHERRHHLGAVPLSNSNVRGIECRCNDPFHNRCGVRRVLTGFQHSAIASGNGARQRREQKQSGIIPWGNDEHHAERFSMHMAFSNLNSQGRRHALRAHPIPQV